MKLLYIQYKAAAVCAYHFEGMQRCALAQLKVSVNPDYHRHPQRNESLQRMLECLIGKVTFFLLQRMQYLIPGFAALRPHKDTFSVSFSTILDSIFQPINQSKPSQQDLALPVPSSQPVSVQTGPVVFQ